MSGHSKWGLRNANDFLNVLRRKYARDHEESTLLHNKTFLEEESLELYEDAAREQAPPLSHPRSKSSQGQPIEALSEIKAPARPQSTFCERLITSNLEQTLRVYEQDLQILSENKAFLEEKIVLMGEKIRKLRELEASNRVLSQENEAARQLLGELVEEYHRSCLLLFHTRVQQQEAFNSARNKLKMLLRETAEDYHYIGFVQHWNVHIATLQRQQDQIDAKVAQEQKARAKQEQQTQEERKKQEGRVKIVPVGAQQKERGRPEDEDYLAPDQPKPKKRMSESEKASLLGDLKSFAKNFKFPSG